MKHARLLPILLTAGALHGQSPEDLAMERTLTTRTAMERTILHRSHATPDFDLVVVDHRRNEPRPQSDVVYLPPEGSNHSLGVYVQNRARPDLVDRLWLDTEVDGCQIRVERATASDVVFSCLGDKSYFGRNGNVVFDARTRKLVTHVTYQPFPLLQAFPTPDGAVLVGSDTKRLLAIEVQGAEPRFTVLSGAAAEPWIARIPDRADLQRRSAMRSVEQAKFEPQRFGAFTIALEDNPSWGPQPVILEGAVRHALPQSTAAENIGPWQLAEDKLWFGKTFYNGEGITGTGAFGYFDPATRSFKLWSLPDLARWSASAILVEPDAAWLALAHRGEYGGSSGGILRFDRRSESVRKFDTPDIAYSLFRVGGKLLAATDFGIDLLEGDRIRRFFVDQDADGSLHIVEAVR